MKRSTTALIAVLAGPLAFIAQTTASAHTHPLKEWLSRETIVAGTITATSGQAFTADVHIVGSALAHRFEPDAPHLSPAASAAAASLSARGATAPEANPVTIKVDRDTGVVVDSDTSARISDLAVGQQFEAELPGPPSAGLWKLIGSDAQAIDAVSPPASAPRAHAFAGTVTDVKRAAAMVTVTVHTTQSQPAGAFSGVRTFSVGAQTLVFGGALTPSSLAAVHVGDIVGGGAVAPGDASASAIDEQPLGLLIDFRAGAGAGADARAAAFTEAEQLLAAKPVSNVLVGKRAEKRGPQ